MDDFSGVERGRGSNPCETTEEEKNKVEYKYKYKGECKYSLEYEICGRKHVTIVVEGGGATAV